MSETVLVAELSWLEYAARLESSPIVFLPVGSLEQHGPHLPLHVDALLPSAFAAAAAISVGGLVLPAISYGYHSMPRSGGGDKFPGTTNIAGTTLMHLVRDVLLEQARHGVRKFCVLVGHFENQWMTTEGIHLAMASLEQQGVRVMQCQYWECFDHDLMMDICDGAYLSMEYEHAALMETSLMMHFHPDSVRVERLPDHSPGDFQPYDMFPESADWVPDSGALMSAKGASAAIGSRLADVVQQTLLAALRREFDGQ